MTASPCRGHASYEEHDAFLDQLADKIVVTACMAHPADPAAAAEMALSAVDVTMVPIAAETCRLDAWHLFTEDEIRLMELTSD